MTSRWICRAIVVLIVVCPAAAQPYYVAIDLNPIGFVESDTTGLAAGQQAGHAKSDADGTYRALLWSGSPAGVVDLNPAGFSNSWAYDVSDGHQVGDGQAEADGAYHALLWSGTAGSAVDLHPTGYSRSYAYVVSNGNQAGSGLSEADDEWHALLWSGTAGSVVDIHPAGFEWSSAEGIGDGQQAGNGKNDADGAVHALLWSGTATSVVDLHPSGYSNSYAYGISGGRQAGYGASTGDGQFHALLWSGTAGSAVDLHPTGYEYSLAQGNSNGWQAGYGKPSSEAANHALLWSGTSENVVNLHEGLSDTYVHTRATNVDVLGNVVGSGYVNAITPHAMLWWKVGTIELADASLGQQVIATENVTLDADKDLTVTGVLTVGESTSLTLADATLTVGGRLQLQLGGALSGRGAVDGPVASDAMSDITATGDLQLGNDGALEGIELGGGLDVASHTVTLHDQDPAVLGSLTEIAGGTLAAGNGVLLGTGGQLTGYGSIAADLATQGYVQGDGDGMEFSGTVTGGGNFGGSITFAGTYSPGDSAAATGFENVRFTSSAIADIEIAGLTPGTDHDQINATGTVTFDGTLSIALIDPFVPSSGNTFQIMTFGARVGEFSAVEGLEIGDGLNFELSYDPGAVVLTVVADVVLFGDRNGDGWVGQADLDIVLAMWGQSGAGIIDPRADVNVDDFVGQTDLDYVLADWGTGTPPTAPQGVPEPSSLVVLALGGLALARRRANATGC